MAYHSTSRKTGHSKLFYFEPRQHSDKPYELSPLKWTHPAVQVSEYLKTIYINHG